MTWDPDSSRQPPADWATDSATADASAVPSTHFQAMCEFFRGESWKYDAIEGQSALRLGCSGENGDWTCYAQVRDEPPRFLFYSVLNVRAIEASRTSVAELLTRVNYGMVLGSFEMDFGDGEIRCKTSAPLSDVAAARELFHTLVYTNLLATDRYLPAVMSVIYAGMSPEQAIARVDG